jgi:hypothetical protein
MLRLDLLWYRRLGASTLYNGMATLVNIGQVSRNVEQGLELLTYFFGVDGLGLTGR